ncbi:MAG: hypothetical protein GX201_07555, partial [Clostridiales bacterium]|nr:hypothetical protein [Clostridiales bacterium]
MYRGVNYFNYLNIIKEMLVMGISGCLCAELLGGIEEGSAIEIKTSCDTLVGKLV